jgi:hypothetical protein
MSAAKHTPGPWKTGNDFVSADRDGRAERLFFIAPLIRRDSDAWVEERANARLIAAAPDLYEALARIADMRDRDGNAIEMHRDELRGIARAALAKVSP